MFTDHITLELQAGKGGDGIIAWRREKYIPKGGPYGGDGGRGGSVILQADSQIPSLEGFRYSRHIKAENGLSGGSNNRTGRSGEDLILKVPCGTLVKEKKSCKILYDLTQNGERWTICRGGRGGRGNSHFKSSTNRAPHQATLGEEGESCHVELELKLIADVGLIGFPNAGKSTLISRAAHVNVKIAPYPFTTLKPNLGYLIEEETGERILLADIPGIIPEAHKNRGLGLEFLRHIERTKLLVFVVDILDEDPLQTFKILRCELEAYNPKLLKKPFFVVLNKIDMLCEEKQYTHRDSRIGNFANPGAPDLRPAKQPISGGDMGDADSLKDGDAGAGKNPIVELRCVYNFPEESVALSALTGQGMEAFTALLKRKLNRYTNPEKRAIVAPAGQLSL